MFSLIHKIKNSLTNKKTLLQWFSGTRFMEKHQKVYCMGVNQEGVKCPRALTCSRYTHSSIDTKCYMNFPLNYDIKNCEVFIPVDSNSSND